MALEASAFRESIDLHRAMKNCELYRSVIPVKIIVMAAIKR
jgi:hypothetical protein